MKKINIISFIFVILTATFAVQAQTATITYQGKLTDNMMEAQGTYQMRFSLFDRAAGGTQIGETIEFKEVEIIDGAFTVELDFGSQAFDGSQRFLEVEVCSSACPNYSKLTPRQKFTSVPYAINSKTAETAKNAALLGGIPASKYLKEDDPRFANPSPQNAKSSNFIQNRTTEQPNSNFHIDGTGAASLFDADTQYNLGGDRILTTSNNTNLFVGIDAGKDNTTGKENTFVGFWAGLKNTTGQNNSFYGVGAGADNTTGNENSFFGTSAGRFNTNGYGNSFYGYSAGFSTTTGFYNSFYGQFAGLNNTIGTSNSFFGRTAGQDNTTGNENSFFGVSAGFENITGSLNTFVGVVAGENNTTGDQNSFFGHRSGRSNTTGSNNSALGYLADVGADNLSYATVIGSGAIVDSSNTIQLGRNGADVVRIGKLSATSGSTDVCLNGNNELAPCSGSFTESAATQDRIKQLETQIEKQESTIKALLKIICAGNPQEAVCTEVKNK